VIRIRALWRRALWRHTLWRRLAAFLVLLVVARAACVFIAETQWFASVGFGDVWRARVVAQLELFAIAFCFCASVLFLIVRAASRPLWQTLELPSTYAILENRIRRFDELFRRLAFCLALVVPFLLAWRLAQAWPEWMLFSHGENLGARDAIFGRDIGFLLFRLAFWRRLQNSAWILISTAAFLLAGLSLRRLFAQISSSRAAPDRTLARHALLLAFALFAVRAAHFYLAKFELQSQSFALPIVILSLGALLCGAAALVCLALSARTFRVRAAFDFSFKRSRTLLIGALILWFAPAWLAIGASRLARFAPDVALQKKQREATRAAWNLDFPRVRETKSMPVFGRTFPALWNNNWLPPAQRDRYFINGKKRLVAIAARESGALQAPESWSNRHLSDNSRGDGISVFDVTRAQGGIPAPLSVPEFRLSQPRFFFGRDAQPWLLTHSATPQGADVSSWWRRAAWAQRLGDINVLLHPPGANQELLFRRAMSERLAALAPFLVPLGEPCPVVLRGRLFWLLDAGTATTSWPHSLSISRGALRGCNAGWDSVKMLMDAATGKVTFYAASENAGPILQAWQNAVPDLFQPLSVMPGEVRAHRRYPAELFAAQVEMLNRTGDQWQNARQLVRPKIAKSDNEVTREIAPSYQLQKGFVLQTLLESRSGKSARIAQLVADCDENYGRLQLQVTKANSPLEFTRKIDAEMVSAIAPDAKAGVVFGDVNLVPSASGALLIVPVFDDGKLVAVFAARAKDFSIIGGGSTTQSALADLSRREKVRRNTRVLSAPELAARAAESGRKMESALRRGALREWHSLAQEQRATLEELQEKLTEN